VDAAHKGAIASRISHSCDPNCEAQIVSSNGKLSISLYTMRHIRCGEELSFDYSCVTESQNEYREAICLCGKNLCRGSFLSLADGKAYQQVIVSHHNFLHRNAILLRAGLEPVAEEDLARLKEFGYKSSILGPSGSNAYKLPDWMLKWISLTLKYIEVEETLLPPSLVEHFPKLYTLETAKLESRGVRDQRVQNLAITVSKIKHILSQPDQCQKPPLFVLSPKEEVDFFWKGEASVLKRVTKLASGELKRFRATGVGKVPGMLSRLSDLQMADAKTPQEAREKLLAIAEILEELARGDGGSKKFAAVIDLIRMFCFTKRFFSCNKVNSFASSAVMCKKHVMYSANSKETERMLGRMQDDDKVYTTGKKYSMQFLWGQLIFWFKQTIYDPNASLSADRRGTLSLPDVESAKGSGASYVSKQRPHMIKTLRDCPDKYWKTGTIWAFKNAAKVYGSPWFDAAMEDPYAAIDTSKIHLDQIFR